MRPLTNVQSETNIAAMVKISIVSQDGATTWNFDHKDVHELSEVKWESAFMGGLGKPSNYRISISSSLGFITANINQFPKAIANLIINLNDEIFRVHKGRVRQIARNGADPNLFELSIYDSLLDANPKFPVEAIVDSYTGVHPEVANADMGYSQYYGKHTRPFFHTAVDCDIDQLIGPFNVSSENHVNSVFFNPDLHLGTDTSQKHNLLIHKDWAQQSGTSNQVSGGYPFEVMDHSPNDVRIWEYDGFLHKDDNIVTNSEGILGTANNGYSSTLAHIDNADDPSAALPVGLLADVTVDKTTRINFSSKFTNTTVTSHSVRIGVTSDDGNHRYVVADSSGATISASVDIQATVGADLFKEDKKGFIEFFVFGSTTGGVTHTGSVALGVSLKSLNYQNYSIFSPQVNCDDIAISENPVQILEDIFNQTGITFRQDHSSSTQVDVQSHHFQCYFAERDLVTRVLDEFGRVTATTLWLGDSGMINMRTYQESGSVTTDAIITTSDMFGFKLMTNPLGTSRFITDKARRIQVDYGYDFQENIYKTHATADKNSNSLCDSANASGVETEIIRQSKYIMEADTASYYLGNIVRKATQDEEFVEMVLPMRYLGIELADVINVRHPMLVSSDNLYQVINVGHQYLKGRIKVTGARLLTLSA